MVLVKNTSKGGEVIICLFTVKSGLKTLLNLETITSLVDEHPLGVLIVNEYLPACVKVSTRLIRLVRFIVSFNFQTTFFDPL